MLENNFFLQQSLKLFKMEFKLVTHHVQLLYIMQNLWQLDILKPIIEQLS